MPPPPPAAASRSLWLDQSEHCGRCGRSRCEPESPSSRFPGNLAGTRGEKLLKLWEEENFNFELYEISMTHDT